MYVEVTRKQLDTDWKVCPFCESCGEIDTDPAHYKELPECWNWEPSDNCPLRFATVLPLDGHDFILLEED